jgi:hypothetical protein
MSILDTSKVDFLWKKVIYGVGKTDGSGAKSGSNETVASPLPVFASQIWAQASNIPASPPASTGGVVQVYTGAARIAATKDATSTLNVTWISGLTDWIPATFSANYSVKVYAGDPQTTGVQIFPDTNNEEYVFDYASGTLHFPNTVPAGVVANGVYLVGYRYVGTKGLTGAGGASKVTVVANIAARDAQTGLAIGDMTFVTDASANGADAGAGEFAMYIWNGSAYTVVATQDSANGDAKTNSVALTAASTGTIALSRAGNGSRIVECTVEVTTPFDGTFDFTIGQAGQQAWVMSVNDHDVKENGVYYITSSTQLSLSQETQINVYVSGTATVGNAVVTLTYA